LATTTAAGAVIVGSGLTISSGVLSRSSSYDPAAPPGAPSGIVFGGLITWNPSPGNTAIYYEVQYTFPGSSTYQTISSNVSSTSLAFSWGGGTIYFRVRGYNADNLPGAWGYSEGAPDGGGGSGSGSANIVEAATAAGFPATGASSTLYIATDSSTVFRFDSSGVYIELGN
jgi:hypothetical protein